MPKTTKKITTIPATLTRFTATPITEQKKPRLITTRITSKAGTIGSSSMSIRTQASRAPAPSIARASSGWSRMRWPGKSTSS